MLHNEVLKSASGPDQKEVRHTCFFGFVILHLIILEEIGFAYMIQFIVANAVSYK